MTRERNLIAAATAQMWRASRPLAAVGVLMLLAFGGALAGLWFDQRLITGAPAWLKPAKFAISTAIYSLTLAWVFTYLQEWPRVRRTVGAITAGVFVLEVALISLQAWRGTTSHFNVATPLDTVLFNVMGAGIAIQTLASVLVLVALWRQHFANEALGTALRAGMLITLLGASTGGLMTRPTEAQLSEARETGRMTTAGAHTVGAPDGGPGLPVTNWSRHHGDLRVPHFVGLHAIQALPLLALVVRRRSNWSDGVRLMRIAGASYAALFALLLAQALRGEPILGLATITTVGVWAFLTFLTVVLSRPNGFAAPQAVRG